MKGRKDFPKFPTKSQNVPKFLHMTTFSPPIWFAIFVTNMSSAVTKQNGRSRFCRSGQGERQENQCYLFKRFALCKVPCMWGCEIESSNICHCFGKSWWFATDRILFGRRLTISLQPISSAWHCWNKTIRWGVDLHIWSPFTNSTVGLDSLFQRKPSLSHPELG